MGSSGTSVRLCRRVPKMVSNLATVSVEQLLELTLFSISFPLPSSWSSDSKLGVYGPPGGIC